MGGGSIRLGRLAGFPLSADWSVLVILALLAWSLADGTLPGGAPGHAAGTYWLAGSVAAALFLGSLLAHELAHALVARHWGVEVRELRLWVFGGVATLGSEPPSPRADLRIAAAGPLTSLALAGGFAVAAGALEVLPVAHLLASVAGWLAGINLVLGLFNLLPGAPLDGGRILRAQLWRRHGDRLRATLTAAQAGRWVAFVLIGLGLGEFLATGHGGGLWTMFIGWFLLTAAGAEEGAATARAALVGVRVRDVMTAKPRTTPGWLTVDEFIDGYLLGDRHSAYPVEDPDGTVVGLVTLEQLRLVPAADRGRRRIRDIAVPLEQVPKAEPDEDVLPLAERLAARSGTRALVFDAGQLVGIVTATDLARALATGTPATGAEHGHQPMRGTR